MVPNPENPEAEEIATRNIKKGEELTDDYREYGYQHRKHPKWLK